MLTCPAGSAEQVSMADASRLKLISQRLDNRILPLYIFEAIRPELPV